MNYDVYINFFKYILVKNYSTLLNEFSEDFECLFFLINYPNFP